ELQAKASLVMPTRRSCRLCRCDRLIPVRDESADALLSTAATKASLAMPTKRSCRLCRCDRLIPARDQPAAELLSTAAGTDRRGCDPAGGADARGARGSRSCPTLQQHTGRRV